MSELYLRSDIDLSFQGGQLLHNLLLFGRVCKVLGMTVTPDSMIEVAHALEFISLGRKIDFYYALRALMVTHQRDIELFDEAFEIFWQTPSEYGTALNIQAVGEPRKRRKNPQLLPPTAEPDENAAAAALSEATLLAIIPTYSQQEALKYKDFAEMTGAELSMARQIIARLPASLGYRETRRFRAGKGQQLDLRRTFRANMRYAGEILSLPTRTHRLKPRPLVLICDISGSMERYTRIFLHFIHTFASSMYQVESFLFSTRLTRITHHIRHKSVDRSLHEVGKRVNTWGAGTKTGEALQDFNYHWSRRVLGRGAIVMLITDGWDRGDPELLKHEIERLQRSCHRLIWLNPLLGAPQYEPLTRGAQAMLPHVDDFLPVRNLSNLEMLVRELQKLS